MRFDVAAPRALLLSPAALLVDRRPGSPRRLARSNTALFVTFFDVLRFALLLVGVFGFVTTRHVIFSAIHVTVAGWLRTKIQFQAPRPAWSTGAPAAILRGHPRNCR